VPLHLSFASWFSCPLCFTHTFRHTPWSVANNLWGVSLETPRKSAFFHKKSLSWYVCCPQATFFRRITHRLGFLDSGNNYTNTLAIQHTQTQHKLYMIVFYFLHHVSIVHIDHHRVEKYKYRRKVLRIFLFCSAFPPVSVFYLMMVNMYNRNTQWKRKKPMYSVCVLCFCGLYC